MLQDDIQLIRARLDEAQNIAVYAHIRPDGDSIGSSLALGWALEDAGKTVQYICEDPVPERFSFLYEMCKDGRAPYVREAVNADCYILPDISDPDRVGRYFLDRPELIPDICIDHHLSNKGYAKLNWIESDSPAASCVMAGLLPKLGFTLTKRISAALLCGIITDTNSFTTVNVNAGCLRSAYELVENGADIYPISYRGYKQHTMEEMALWKLGMDNIRIEGDLIWTVIRKKDRDAIGCADDEDHGFVSYMVNTKGIMVSVLFMEISENETKISWRSQPGFNVAEVAVAHGGGGHAAASGATVYGPIEEQIPLVLAKTKAMLF